MIAIALTLLAVGSGCFLLRLFLGPTVADRVVALDGLLVAVMCGILVHSTRQSPSFDLDTVLVVSLVSFVGTGVLARYIEQRNG